MNPIQKRYFGIPHIYLDIVDSTNSYAHDVISKNNPSEGTAISAGFQTNGRGQIGRLWEGEADKNIYTSIILKPSFVKPADQFLINQAISIGLSEFCRITLNKVVRIKWPNDIYVRNRKLCGILIQYILSGNTINYGIIGIGVNVNQQNFSNELHNPTSMILEKKMVMDIKNLREDLFSSLEYWYEKLKSGEISEIREKYLSILYRLHEECIFLVKGKKLTGVIVGVEDQGRLMIKTNSRVEAFSLNELKMIIE